MPTKTEPPDQEPSHVPAPPAASPPKTKGGRKATSSIRRELSEKELQSPATTMFLLDEVDRLEQENAELLEYRGRFHESDKKAAVLDQKLNFNRGQEVISITCVTLGGAALGFAPSVWAATTSTGPIILIAGIVLIVCGVAAKAVKA